MCFRGGFSNAAYVLKEFSYSVFFTNDAPSSVCIRPFSFYCIFPSSHSLFQFLWCYFSFYMLILTLYIFTEINLSHYASQLNYVAAHIENKMCAAQQGIWGQGYRLRVSSFHRPSGPPWELRAASQHKYSPSVLLAMIHQLRSLI